MHRLFNRFGGLLLAAQFFISTCITPGAYAQEATTNLNLADTNATISAQLGGAATATLQVSDGSTLNITSGTLLTPAQNLALQQVLVGQQNLQINNLGQAVGGGFQIPTGAAQNISSLVIPQGVTGIQDFAVGGLNLSGNFQNSGNFYGYSSNATTTTANIAANNIINDQNAILSTLLPSGGFAALGFSVNSAVSNLSLNLTAINNIINSGAIYSAGNLTAVAGGSIINALPAGVTGVSPIMQAMQNVNLIANSITNSGIINSQLANINIAGMTASNLLISNIGGRMEALTGAINVRDQLFTTKHDLNILGGDLISQELNLFSGDGIVNMNVQEVTGLINVNAGIAHLKAATPLMQIGNISLTGDPTFYNSLGDLSVGDLNFSGQDLALVASGNIVVNGAITTAGTAGGDVLVFAGAKFEDDFSGSQLPEEPYQSSTIRVIGVFEGGTISIFDTNGISIDSTGSGGDGGNVTLVADGHISVANRIVTGGAENSGNVTVISKGGINVRDIDTSGNLPPGGITTGNISILTYQPSIKSGVLEVTNGTIINSGGFDTTSRGLVSANGTIVADDLKTSGGGIFLRAGNTIEVDNLRASSPDFGGFISIEAHQVTDSASPFIVGASATNDGVRGVIESTGSFGGGISISSDATGGITIESWNDITVAASGGIGGEISVSANNGPLNVDGGTIDLNGVGSGGGEFSLQSGSTLTITNNLIVNANGDGDSSGGDMLIQAATLNLQGSLTTNSNSTGSGDGGDISVDGISGTLQIVGPGSLTINANAGNDGAGGIIEVEANFNMGGDLTLKADGGMFGGEITVDTNTLTAGNITITADQGFFEGFRGFGGEIDITNNNSGDISITTGALVLSANTVDHTAGDIIIEAANLDITAASISIGANATGNGNGGFVSLAADKFAATSVISLSANGSGTGYGGEVDVYTYGADGDITVGGGSGQVQVSVTGGSAGSESGDAGLAFFSAARNLTVDVNAINAVPLGDNGAGAWLTFESATSGTGILNVNGAIVADGIGNGDGGQITIVSRDSNQDLVIGTGPGNLQLSATGGSVNSLSGNGGLISLQGNKNIIVVTTSIQASALGTEGDGGSFIAKTIDGNIQILGDIDLAGRGTGNGGNITLASEIGDVNIGSAILLSHVNAAGGRSANTDPNNLISIAAGSNVNIFGGINVNATDGDKSGGQIELSAGMNGSGSIYLNGDLIANSFGDGDGGVITFNINTSETLVVTGNVTADALGLGHSGELMFINLADNDFDIQLAGLISAASLGGGESGTQFYNSANGINISTIENTTLRGPLSVDGRSISISSENPGVVLQVTKLIAQQGSIDISLSGDNSKVIIVGPTAQVIAKDNINISFTRVADNVVFNSGTLENLGTIESTEGSLTIDANTINNGNGSGILASGVLTLGVSNLTNNGLITGGDQLAIGFRADLNVAGNGTLAVEQGNVSFVGLAENLSLFFSGKQEVISGGASEFRIGTDAQSAKLLLVHLAPAAELNSLLPAYLKSAQLSTSTGAVFAGNFVRVFAPVIENNGKIESQNGLYLLASDDPSNGPLRIITISGNGMFKATGDLKISGLSASQSALLLDQLSFNSSSQFEATGNLNFFSKLTTVALGQTIVLKAPNVVVESRKLIILGSAKIESTAQLRLISTEISNSGTVSAITKLDIEGTPDFLDETNLPTLLLNGNGTYSAPAIEVQGTSPDDPNAVVFLSSLSISGNILFDTPAFGAYSQDIYVHPDAELNCIGICHLQARTIRNGGLIKSNTETVRFIADSKFSVGMIITGYLQPGSDDTKGIVSGRQVFFENLRNGITVDQERIDGLVSAQATRNISITTNSGSLEIANISSLVPTLDPVGGGIFIKHGGDLLSIAVNGSLITTAGSIVLHGTKVGGRIVIGQAANILATAIGNSGQDGAVKIFASAAIAPFIGSGSGPFPITVGGLTPEKVNLSASNISTINALDEITLKSQGGALQINAVTGTVEIQGGVNITAVNVSQVDLKIFSLDLKSQSVLDRLITMQQYGLVGGQLHMQGSDMSGTLELNQSNLPDKFQSLNIPTTVEVAFTDLLPGTEVAIDGVNGPAIIDGSLAFINANPGQENLAIMSVQGASSILIKNTGIVSSNGSLTVRSALLSNDGLINVSSQLSLESNDAMVVNGTGTFVANNLVVGSANEPLAMSGSLNFTADKTNLLGTVIEVSSASSLVFHGAANIITPIFNCDGEIFTEGNVTIKSNSSLMVSGNGSLHANDALISLFANTAGVLRISGNISIDPGFLGALSLNYDPEMNQSSMVPLIFDTNSNITLNSGAVGNINTSQITLNDASGIIATGTSLLQWHSEAETKTLTIIDGGNAVFSTNGGAFNFGQFSRTSLTFAKSSGAGIGTINFSGGPLATYTSQGNSVTIDPGVIINTNNNITFNIHDGGTFINNGTVQSSANGGRIIIDAFAYPITLMGSGTTKFTGTNGAFFVLTAGLGSINVNSNPNFDFSGNGGFVSFQAHTLNLMPGVQVNALNGGAFEFIGNTLNMGAQSNINTSVTSGIGVSITAPNVLLPADSFATMSSLGGDIVFTPSELAFTKAGGTETTLNLLGGKLITSSSVGPTLIDTGVTLASNNNISMQVFGSNQLILNGNITASAPGASILITSSPIVTLAGVPASISATGGGNSTITIIGYDNGLNINSSYSLDAGSDGIVSLHAPDGVMTIASGVNVTINGGSQLVIATASLVMEANSKITVDKSIGTALAWGAEAHRSLKLSGPSGSSATIETTGGDIDIFGAGTGLPFTISKMPNSGETTLNLNGGNVTLSALDTSLTIESGVTVASDKNLLVSLTGSTFNNQGTLSLSNGGSLSINADAQSTIVNMGAIAINGGSMNVSSASDIVINDTIAMAGAGTLNISTLAGSNADIVINTNIGGGTTTNLTADGSGNIAQNGGVISGTAVSLASGSGNIGSEGQNITTNATSLTANTTATGSVYITNNDSVDVGNSSAGETFQLTAIGNIKTLGIVSANNVVLQAAPGSGGSVFADPDIIGTTSITIRADGAGTITQLPGIRLVAPTVILESQDGDIGTTTTSIKTVADTLIVHTGAAASAYVSEMDNVALDASSVGQTFRLRAKGDITVVGNVAANDVRLITTSPTGAIIVTAAVTGISNVTLRTKDSGNVVIDQTSSVTANNGTVLIRANDLKLDGTINAGTGQVTLRANGNKAMALADVADANGNDAAFDINASELSKITAGMLVIGDQQNTTGLVIQDNINVSGVGAAGNFDLTFRSGGNYTATGISINLGDRSLDVNVDGTASSGNVSANLGDIKLVGGNGITVTGALTTTGNVTLNTSTDGNGGITLQASVTSGGNLKLTAHGTGAITQIAGTLTANNLHLTADNGNIGESNQPLNTNATKLFADTLGSVHINEFDDLVIGNSSSGGNFSVIAGGAITVNNILTQNGSILVSAGAGALTVGGQSVIFANEGNLHLQNRNTTSGAIVIGKDSILGANSASETSLGNVYITIGDIPTAPTAGTPPSKVTVITANGGQAYFDTTGITAQGAQSTVNVNDRTVLFETGGLGAGSIKLKGDVNISAGSSLEPIAFLHNKPMAGIKNMGSICPASLSTNSWVKDHQAQVVEDTAGNLKLIEGEIVVVSNRTQRIYAGKYVIKITDGVICEVQLKHNILIVKNLHDKHNGSMSVIYGNKTIKISTGQELIIGETKHAIASTLNNDQIARRNVHLFVQDNQYVVTSEFSLLSEMKHSRLIAKIVSLKSGSDQNFKANLIKTAACLMSLSGGKEPYKKQNLKGHGG